MEDKLIRDYVVIKAVDDGVNVIGLTRGTDTRFHHSEKLDSGEVMIAQFTEHTSAIKVRGNAKIYTPFGEVQSEAKRSQPGK
ncbi:trp RNA-binding attenuation protein MtrB [Bacillus sp. V5-8f]|uniref:trp RNA-binding attenuation protein MtrB n=1 Tax=Bacillus sp. V5-8f TaxID=2053044 RepID=UPI000C77E08F|nr:trp RNA-binding attenuation protein MtrB [Bacillus sp. V5-8f]PLT34869.1 trp RNA-binding attenuation protein MtrB [Bacillus sp. V5-8f]